MSNKIVFPFVLNLFCLSHLVMGYNIFDFCKDFAELFKFFEIDFAQYDTGQSQVARSMNCAESLFTAAPSQWSFLETFVLAFKGTMSQK